MRKPTPSRQFSCPIDAAMSMIGGKWKALLLFHLLDGPRRFGELQRLLVSGGVGITQRMLTLQLRELQQDGVIARAVHAQLPLRVEYSLTATGASLREVVMALRAWGTTYLQAHGGEVAPCSPAMPSLAKRR